MRTLVIDVGTTGLRSAIVHQDGSISDLHHEQFPPSSPAPGLVEFDAMEMWHAVLRVTTATLTNNTVGALALTCQRASTVLWNRRTGEPVGPALGWQDLRTVGDCITARHEHGIAVAPNQTATKASWLLANHGRGHPDPDELLIGTVDSWLVWKLTDGRRHITDHTNAAVTGLTSNELQWDEATCVALGIEVAQLPTIVQTAAHIDEATALPGAPPIMAVVGDQQASLVGQGCIEPGLAKITFGTGGMLDLFTGRDSPGTSQRRSAGTFPIVAFSMDGHIDFGSEAIMLSAGTNVEWLRDGLGLIDTAADSDRIAATCETSEGVFYVPALVGLGTPHWDYGARGSLFGITRGTTSAHIVRAVLEGIAHRGADLVEAAERDSGLSIGELRIDGGMSRNPTFVQALANASQRPVRVCTHTEATTVGAGYLAGSVSGQWSHLDQATSTVTWSATVDPLGDGLAQRQQWTEAVSRTRAWIPELSALDF